MKLWGGRFREETDDLVNAFNASISFDKRFFRHDITGSIAHVTMLARQQVLTEEERDRIIAGLEGILPQGGQHSGGQILPPIVIIHSNAFEYVTPPAASSNQGFTLPNKRCAVKLCIRGKSCFLEQGAPGFFLASSQQINQFDIHLLTAFFTIIHHSRQVANKISKKNCNLSCM